VHIDSKEKIAGFPILEVRALLRSRLDQCLSVAAVVRRLAISESKAAELITALMELGYLEEPEPAGTEEPLIWPCSDLGVRFSLASAAPPVTRKVAQARLKDLLRRSLVVNSSDDFLLRVVTVGVFGSYLSDQARINDVDIAIDLAKKPGVRFRPDTIAAHARSFGVVIRGLKQRVSWPRRHVILFLKNRSRTLSMHMLDHVRDELGIECATYIENGELTELGRTLLQADERNTPARNRTFG
jgi:hypothetical protein